MKGCFSKNKRLLLILLILGCLSNGAFASSDKQVTEAADVDSVIWSHGVEYFGPGASLLTTGRKPTDEEYVIMNFMKYDSINLIYKYYFPQTMKTADKRHIDDWLVKNEELLDSCLLRTSLRIHKLNRNLPTVNDILYPHGCADELDAALKKSILRRRQYLHQRTEDNDQEHKVTDYWIDNIEKNFIGNESKPSLVKSVYLNTDQKATIDVINFLNGSTWIDYSDGTIDNEQMLKIRDWIWVNRGNVPDEVFGEMIHDVVFEIYFDWEPFYPDDPKKFEEFKAAKFEDEIFDKYRNLPIIKME